MHSQSRITLAVLVTALALAAPTAGRADTPDAWVTTKAKMALLTTEGVSGTAISVDTMSGRVTLHGKVESADEKAKADEVVRTIAGVKDVRNLLQVVPKARQAAVETADAQLKDQVEKALKDDGALADGSIAVQSVNAGVVLLGGKAESLQDHLRAIQDAAAVPGVRHVASEIQSPEVLADNEIRSEERQAPGTMARGREGAASGTETASDMYITSAIKLHLLADGRTPALEVNVDTNRGVVTLFGMVPSNEAKNAAGADAHKVNGVQRVVNALEVVASSRQAAVKANDKDLKRDVKQSLGAREELTASTITVDVQNGVARLTGTVPNQTDRLTAAIAARSTPGVRSVQDDLLISAPHAMN